MELILIMQIKYLICNYKDSGVLFCLKLECGFSKMSIRSGHKLLIFYSCRQEIRPGGLTAQSGNANVGNINVETTGVSAYKI